MTEVFLKPHREKVALNRHLWIYSGAIARVNGQCENGGTVKVCDSQGNFLAYAALSKSSQLALRIWSFDENAVIDEGYFFQKLSTAWALRERLEIFKNSTVCRICASEADGLPGVTIDRYGDYCCLQLSSAGADLHRREITNALQKLYPWQGIFERSDVSVRNYENLEERTGLLAGSMPPERLEVNECGRKFYVDIAHGHKTGFYCDQRDNRSLVQRFSAGGEVLNMFAYTGGFGVAAALGGAKKVINVDSSAPALALAAENFKLNDIPETQYENVEADGFSYLRKLRGEHRKFDIVILDPPKLVESMKALPRGCRAYKDAMLQGFYLLKPGGLMFTYSCSGLVNKELFRKIAADAALDAKCDARIVADLTQASDHPVPCAFPEAGYLKGLLIMKCN